MTARDGHQVAVAVERERVDPKIVAKIAARTELADTVTDSLLKRGNPAVQRTLLENPMPASRKAASPASSWASTAT